MKNRWKFGNYTMVYNPKSFNGAIDATGKSTVNVNGVISVNNLFYDETMGFTIDIFQKPTAIDRTPLKTISTSYYSSIAEKKTLSELYCLRGSVIDILSSSGVLARSFNVVTVSGGTPVSITGVDTGIAVFYNNQTLVIQDESSNQISKYTYDDDDLLDIVGITAEYGTNNIYAINKYGKVFRMLLNSSLYELVYQFADFAINKAATKAVYSSIHMIDSYFGILQNNSKILYAKPTTPLTIVHATEFKTRSIKDISFGVFTRNVRFLETTQISKVRPDYCGIDKDKIISQLSLGAVAVVDDNNATHYLLIKGASVKRIRNLGDSRYEISISGKIMQ